jgi:hypothetical protein
MTDRDDAARGAGQGDAPAAGYSVRDVLAAGPAADAVCRPPTAPVASSAGRPLPEPPGRDGRHGEREVAA